MKTKPKYLNVLAAVILAAALSLPVQIMILYGHPPSEIGAIAAKISPLNWLILFICPVVAVMVYRASPLLVAAVPMLATLIIYNNWFVGRTSLDYSPWVTTFASVFFCVALGGLFTQDVRRVIMNPKLRWWLTPTRKIAEIPVRLRVLNGRYKSGKEEFYTVTFDLSEGGAFIPFGRERGQVRELRLVDATSSITKTGSGEAFSMRNLTAGTQCYICLNLGELAFVHCRAEVVRVAQATGKYPAGVGIKFLGLTGQEKRVIASFIEDLEEQEGLNSSRHSGSGGRSAKDASKAQTA